MACNPLMTTLGKLVLSNVAGQTDVWENALSELRKEVQVEVERVGFLALSGQSEASAGFVNRNEEPGSSDDEE